MSRLSLMMVFLLILAAIPVQAEESQPLPVEVEVHQLINDERVNIERHGVELLPLKLHSDLITVARTHSEDMANRNYFDHVNPEGEDAFDRLDSYGIDYHQAGENLFRSARIDNIEQMAQDAVEGWIDSPGHYANILTDFEYTGIGYYELQGEYYLTQVFVSADRAHLEEQGIIYDNDNLDTFGEEEEGFFSRYLNQNTLIAIIVIGAILLGIDAQRRNRSYYQRNRRGRSRNL